MPTHRMRNAGGRPSLAAAGELDRIILAAATDAFLKQGYAATSVDHIARQVGCSKPTIYRRYRSKEDLFRAVVRNRCRCLAEVAQDAEMLRQDPVVALREMIGQLLRFCLEPETLQTYRILVTDGLRVPGLTDSLAGEITRPFHRRIAALLTRALGRDETEETARDVERLSRNLSGMIVHWPMHQALAGIAPFADEAAQEEYFAASWRLVELMLRQERVAD